MTRDDSKVELSQPIILVADALIPQSRQAETDYDVVHSMDKTVIKEKQNKYV